MTKDCSLNWVKYKKIPSSVHVVYINCLECQNKKQTNNYCTQHVLALLFNNNLLSYCVHFCIQNKSIIFLPKNWYLESQIMCSRISLFYAKNCNFRYRFHSEGKKDAWISQVRRVNHTKFLLWIVLKID